MLGLSFRALVGCANQSMTATVKMHTAHRAVEAGLVVRSNALVRAIGRSLAWPHKRNSAKEEHCGELV